MIMPVVWHCNECNFDFGNPMIDTKTDKMYCPYCGSKQIERR
jgi:DNA-directed RNA polymerase subunit RPC12/RpoP